MNWLVFSYQLFIEKVSKDNQANTDAILKANLPCIKDFRLVSGNLFRSFVIWHCTSVTVVVSLGIT